MKILFVSESYPSQDLPQYGIFIKQQAQALQTLGNRVDVFVPNRCGTNGRIAFRDGAYRVDYRTLRYELFPVAAARPVYRQLKTLLHEQEYDLVAVHITSDSFLALTVKACNALDIPVVAHYHGLNVWEEFAPVHPCRQKLFAARRCRILQRTQGAVGVSDKVSDILRRRLNVPVQTVYNGVDTGLFIRKPRGDGAFRVIGVGNLIEIKGFSYLLEAFASLHRELPDCRLDILGDGALRKPLTALAEQLGVSDVVTFHGKVPYDRVAEEMAKSNLFVLPSFYEALGCVYLEAMGCGLPTIGVAGMGIDEIIAHGENGLLVKPKDSRDLYEKMRLVATDAELANQLAENGAETARQYTWDASAQTLNRFYEACIKNEFSVFNG